MRARPETLRALHAKVVRGGAQFGRLADSARHRIRKRLKRLRYLSEFVAAFYPPAAVERYLVALQPAQDELGKYNDYLVAAAIARSAAECGDADARFALGWLTKRSKKSAKKCRRALARIADAPQFWKPARRAD